MTDRPGRAAAARPADAGRPGSTSMRDPPTGPPIDPAAARPPSDAATRRRRARRPDDALRAMPVARPRRDKDQARTPIVPAGSVTGRSLTLVITIMCFLACLTAGAVYMINQSRLGLAARHRQRGDGAGRAARERPTSTRSSREVTQLPDAPARHRRRARRSAVADSAAAARAVARPVRRAESAAGAAPDRRRARSHRAARSRRSCAARSASSSSGVTLDDHRHWQQQIRTVTRSFALGGLAILLLVGAATTAIIVSATRSAMASNREIVEVLHSSAPPTASSPASSSGISCGSASAPAWSAPCWPWSVFLAMPTVMELLGGGAVTMAEMQRLIGTGALDLKGYLLLGGVVVVIAALCMLTSRIGVYRILQQPAVNAVKAPVSANRCWRLDRAVTTGVAIGERRIVWAGHRTGWMGDRSEQHARQATSRPALLVYAGAGLVCRADARLRRCSQPSRCTQAACPTSPAADGIVVLTGGEHPHRLKACACWPTARAAGC